MKFLMALLLFVAVAFGQNSHLLTMPNVIADSLPWFAVRELGVAGEPFTKTHLQQLSEKNERVALVYFATWCLPCRAGIKRLAAAQNELVQNKVGVVLVNVGEPDEKRVRRWLEKAKASNIKVVVDPFRRMTENFGLVNEGEEMSLPKTLLVDSKARPLMLVGQEGDDWPQILWEK